MTKVLIVEDDVFVGRTFERIFSLNKYEVVLVGTGKEGLEQAKTARPDLIMLDILMPDIDGIEVLRRLKRDVATSKIPVVIVTNSAEEKQVKQARSLGAVDYLLKAEYTPDQLVEKIKRCLQAGKS